MRDFKNMKRQRGRNRGGGGPSSGGGNGGGKPQNANRAFDSNGPDNVKIRGHAQHVFEKYQQLARDAFSSGDRVVAENYLQHADHYFRVLRTLQPQRSPSEILGRDSLASGLDIDFEEEFELADDTAEIAAEASAAEMNGGGEPRSDGRQAERYDRQDVRRENGDYREARPDYRNNGEGQRNGEGQYRDRQSTPRFERDRNEPRDSQGERTEFRDRQQQPLSRPDRDRPDRDRPDRDRSDTRERTDTRERSEARDGQDNRDRSSRDTRDRPERERPDRSEAREPREGQGGRRFEGRRDERPYNRDGREPSRSEDRGDERRPAAATADPLPLVAPEPALLPFPSSAPDADTSPVLRSEDGGMSEAPAFLQPASGEDAEARKPRTRRRRAPRSFEAPEGGDATPIAEPEDA